jgi:hypothetical protein
VTTRRRGSLVVVGTGICGIAQTTLEAVACMERAEKLFYTVIEPTTALWIRGINPAAISLTELYGEGKDRTTTYKEMTARIVDAVRGGFRVCAVFYGHPGVLVQSTHNAIRRLRREGYQARMLPAVSADGCLFADLGLNPGDAGIQSFEATDFLLSKRRFDATSSLLLWQVGVLGESDARQGATCRPDRLATLTRVLRTHYPATHVVVLYYASTFPGRRFIAKRIRLRDLPRAVVYPMAMLYVPALPQRAADAGVLRWLDEPAEVAQSAPNAVRVRRRRAPVVRTQA